MNAFDDLRSQIFALNGELESLEYNAARDKFSKIQKFFDEHLLSAEGFEQKTSNRELHDLHKKIEKKKPKTKLSLLKKKKAPQASQSLDTVKTSLEKKKEPETKVGERSSLHSLKGETKVYESSRNEDLVFQDFEDCTLSVKGSVGSLRIENMKNSKIFLEDSVLGAAMVRRCENCEFEIASRQLRIQNCKNTDFKIAVCSKVALEESDTLGFGVHPRLAQVSKEMKEENMVILENSHLEINDFEWPDTHTPSPNWKEI
ncbi:Oidioi.mRNA.OKI2018_I69.PAR.g12149.t1.cds [Oikopleura dioica]|uniref:Oidioi.mRNA.OKI2018_I69.PAR.g12149.t1.cds n=1 Tax=Oikopleura dioica TaxID=34765 RepID=A0ABN7RYW4_OIKDI|nr:Oidioi.mRNA.OKI2018_I69.PAR.g12149.t1.cds [Oikopleura dioica]